MTVPPGDPPALPHQPVVIVDYDPEWPRLFEEEKARILEACGEWLAGIEHIGSTSVPGLPAKPIIDIMPGLRRLEDGANCIAPLKALGYQYLGEYGIPDRLYFNRGVPRSHHVHMYEVHKGQWDWHLLFRDYLRKYPEVAQNYARLKYKLSAQHHDDVNVYAEAKSEFVDDVIALAAAELGVPAPRRVP
ncbi:MAG: GrpB family protein [Dehalococcoidia bacterium]